MKLLKFIIDFPSSLMFFICVLIYVLFNLVSLVNEMKKDKSNFIENMEIKLNVFYPPFHIRLVFNLCIYFILFKNLS